MTCQKMTIRRRFQHTAARRRLGPKSRKAATLRPFQHTAARRRLVHIRLLYFLIQFSFNTQPPEGGWFPDVPQATHHRGFQHTAARRRLAGVVFPRIDPPVFQHTAARRRLVLGALGVVFRLPVSTHSRPKAAGITQVQAALSGEVSTHSRPKAAGDEPLPAACPKLGFNTQPPEGGWPENDLLLRFNAVSTHSRPKAAGQSHSLGHVLLWFQHTAARRRLARQLLGYSRQIRFNTQPPEGGWGLAGVVWGD